MIKKLAALVIVCFSFSGLQALCFNLDLTNGYRQDRITTLVDVFDPPGTLEFTDDLKATDISIYQIGLKGRLSFCNFLVRAEGDYGWVCHGKYNEFLTIPGFAPSVLTAKIHQGDTQDLIIGGGYLLSFLNCVEIGPVGGWSYQYQKFSINHAKTDGIPSPLLDGVKYSNRWQGPWIGIDAAIRFCQITLRGGYEYHWADWHAVWHLAGPDNPAVDFSDQRNSNHATGQVAYVDGKWNFASCWNIGLGFKWQQWRAFNGQLTPLTGTFSSSTEVDDVKRAEWCSYAATFDIGYAF